MERCTKTLKYAPNWVKFHASRLYFTSLLHLDVPFPSLNLPASPQFSSLLIFNKSICFASPQSFPPSMCHFSCFASSFFEICSTSHEFVAKTLISYILKTSKVAHFLFQQRFRDCIKPEQYRSMKKCI